jgi:enamine deaminase RidA (YjgF/YER057c/UK114 family)
MLTAINPKAIAPNPAYSQGIVAQDTQRTLYVSGQVGIDGNGNVGKDISEQATLAVANLNAVLAEAGMDNTHLAKLTIYLTDDSLIPGFIAAAGAALPNPPPATTLLVVKALAAPPLLVEIEGLATL